LGKRNEGKEGEGKRGYTLERSRNEFNEQLTTLPIQTQQMGIIGKGGKSGGDKGKNLTRVKIRWIRGSQTRQVDVLYVHRLVLEVHAGVILRRVVGRHWRDLRFEGRVAR